MSFLDKIITEMPRAIEGAGQSGIKAVGGMEGLMKKYRSTEVTMPLMETMEKIRATHSLIPAIPTDEPIGSAVDAPNMNEVPKVVGIDGSQIYPSEHVAVQWGYVRALAIHGKKVLETGRFFTAEDLKDEDPGDFNARKIDSWREAYESEIIAQAAEDPEWRNHVILTDGSLIPWSGMEKKMANVSGVYRKNIQRANGKLLAGIISSPRSRYCMNLLRIALMSEGKSDHEIPVSDTVFYKNYLETGQRSAVFLHGSPVNDDFSAAIHMFYLKISGSEVFRVEIPAWVAHDPEKVAAIHASVIQDSAGLDYPYSLINAHDTVKISLDVASELQRKFDQAYYREYGSTLMLPAKARLKNACSG